MMSKLQIKLKEKKYFILRIIDIKFFYLQKWGGDVQTPFFISIFIRKWRINYMNFIYMFWNYFRNNFWNISITEAISGTISIMQEFQEKLQSQKPSGVFVGITSELNDWLTLNILCDGKSSISEHCLAILRFLNGLLKPFVGDESSSKHSSKIAYCNRRFLAALNYHQQKHR